MKSKRESASEDAGRPTNAAARRRDSDAQEALPRTAADNHPSPHKHPAYVPAVNDFLLKAGQPPRYAVAQTPTQESPRE